ncbi:MAG: hypothetical protein GXY87_01010 [Tissierellia bacterium]|nr:hypothetical protein [Tissierellia bacterium]
MSNKANMKFFATLGPNFQTYDILLKANEMGITGLRLNLSHGLLEERLDWINNVKKANQISKKPYGPLEIVLDIQGSEIRIRSNKTITKEKGSNIFIKTYSSDYCEDDILYVNENFIINTKVGDIIHIDDGKVEAVVENIESNTLFAKLSENSIIEPNKSISIQNKYIANDTINPDDIKNIKLAKQLGIKNFMIPFVRSKKDIIILRELFTSLDFEDYRLYSKIEDQLGIDNIDEIIDNSDVIVIARGDLGNNLGLLSIPRAQKYISKKCNDKNKQFMVVTQLLNSMIDSTVPTRAEINDIYNSTLDGAQMLMITAETAVGKYPLKACYYLIEAANI